MNEEIIENEQKDFAKNWVNSSRFLFYLTVFCFIAFVAGCSFRIYNQRYKGKPDVEVQSSSKYKPEYK
jgi:hypothetical protein